MPEQSQEAVNRFKQLMRPVVKHSPVLYGWGGLFAVGGWAFFGISTGWLYAAALLNSFLLAMYGHHGNAMGWFDDL